MKKPGRKRMSEGKRTHASEILAGRMESLSGGKVSRLQEGLKIKEERPALTGRQREVLEFVKDFIEKDCRPPTAREIADHFGFSSINSARQHLMLIARKGYIDLEGKSARGIKIAGMMRPGGQALKISVIGRVAAGTPVLAIENIEREIYIDRDLFGGGEVFGLRVRGASMRDAGIHDGDIAIVRKQQVANNGEIVVALVDGEAVVKRFFKSRNRIILRSENPNYPDITVSDPEQFRLVGKVIGIMRTV